MAFNRPVGRKRRREPYNVDIKLVEIYEDLASEKDEIRLRAAQGLVSQFTPDKSPAEEQIKKTLQRLFRGLCSSRKAARIGFSIALTEVLTQVFSVARESSEFGVADVLNIWESQSNATGSETGQEQRDHHFGRLFGAEAIIKSGILFQPSTPFAEWTKVLDLILDLAHKKTWLREECGWIIYRCVYDLSARQMDATFVEAAVERVCSYELARSPEGVAVWLAVKDMFPTAELPAKVWKHDDPLDPKERGNLAKIMKESSAEENDGENKGSKSSGVWNSKLHFAWDAVISRTSVKDASSKTKTKSKSSRLSFVDFWTEVVDNGLFASSSSDERKYWGFLLFHKILNEGSLQQANHIFTKNLVRCLTNQLAVEDRYLHRMAAKAAKAIQIRVSKEPIFAAVAVRGLMGSNGVVNFDQVTKTKTVEKLVADANSEALTEIVPLFETLLKNPGTTDEKAAASNRQFVAGIMLNIVRAKAATGNAESDEDYQSVLEQILFIFVRFAYFMDSTPEPALTQATQELLRNRINSALNSLLASRKYAATIPYAVVRQIRDGAKSKEYGKFIINIDDKLDESVKTAFKSLKKLSSKEKKEENPSIAAFKLLYSLTVLQVYSGDADAVSMLDELEFCYGKFMGEENNSEDTSDASDALVEILLSFASKQSQLFRRMSEQVFGAFADQVTENGLESLISILEAKESLAGQQEMFDDQGDGDEDDDEDEEDDVEMVDAEDLDSDVEVVSGGDASESESDEEEDDDEGEEENEENAAEIAEFEAKLAAALGTHRADQDPNASDSDSDADMNDDEMEEVDEKLANVFRARHQAASQVKDKKDARENMVNFKNRVLDLLEIFVKKCHSRLLAMDLLLPLLRLARRSTVKQIANKANSVLREYTKLCKGNAIPKISGDDNAPEAVWELLRAIHKEAGHSGPPAHTTACSQASLLVVKVLVAHDKAAIADVVDVYAATRKGQLMSSKCHIQPSFFTDWNNWCVSASKQLKN
ncbi:hypothetical protein N7539_004345 [Penicillium diatomitis]|uniref:DNA polymerase V n=1 Tax=Penicillium diatomitis TaxID=2819901 RepID=A0A9W9XDN2_9EURO|nr:uncharacterized protein N7539_004345 [Penicillium diatomitis]KAJ5489455.1 hypothetical protein N7539_004345 [Penicillium diatomitis]